MKVGLKMDNNKPINISIEAQIPPSVDNALKNLTDKPTHSIGTTFSDLWDLVFGGISYLSEKKKIEYAHKLDLFRKELEDSIKQIPPEKATEPSIQITAQALENSKYCISEDELRQMFTALISNSMNADFSKDIHPSFAEILKQMAPLDAAIIKVFKNSPTNGLPICQYNLNSGNGFKLLLENVFLKYPNTYLPDNSLSISSLSRLGLLEIRYSEWLLNESVYIPFREHLWFKLLQKEFPGQTIDLQKGLVRLTPLGRSFTNVCIQN